MRIRLSLCLLLLSSGSAAAQSLTEAVAVERGLAHPDVRALLEARRAVNAGNVLSAGRWANPEIEFSRETLDAAGRASEDNFLWIRQRINVAGVKGLERQSAVHQRMADDARVDLIEREIAADIRRLFHSALAANREVEVRGVWHARLLEIAVSIRERVRAGDVSRYDRLRIEREVALVEGAMYAARARYEASRDRLFSRIGGGDESLAGTLLPPAVESELIADQLASHPRLMSLAAEAESAAIAANAASRERWPELTLGVGQRDLSQPGANGDGDLYMLGVEVPLFDRGDGKRRAADSRARARRAAYAIAADGLAAELRASIILLNARRDAALLLGPDASAAASLADIAESAYDAGEIGVMELIDAHRADLQIQTDYVSRALEAREAYIQFQLIRGQP